MPHEVARHDSKSYWALVEQMSLETRRWPEWKRRAADAVFISPLRDREHSPSSTAEMRTSA